jgi:hypothetical protein
MLSPAAMRLTTLIAATATLTVATAGAARTARADHLTVGAALGETETTSDANSGNSASGTFGLFGRLKVAPRISIQLDINKADSPASSSGVTIRQATALAVVDLTGGRLVPILLGGVGLDWSSTPDGDALYHHIELGAGLEYRFFAGLSIGIDGRIGTRSLDAGGSSEVEYAPQYVPNGGLAEGQYRSVRLTAAFGF